MRIRPVVMGTMLAASLVAQGNDQGFQWVGLRAGGLSFDPAEALKAASFLGGQGGMVFDQQRYGLSLEGLSSHPESRLAPNNKLNHREISLTLMTGLSGDADSRFWPYFGLGLGGYTVAKTTASPSPETSTSTEAHASFGFLHRPAGPLIWGLEGRYLVIFTNPGLNSYQGSVLLGFSWGGQGARRTEPSTPAPAPVAPPPPAPLPVVEAPPPAPPPIVAPVPQATVSAASTTPLPPPAPPAAVPTLAPAPAPLITAPVLEPPIVEEATLTARVDALILGDTAKALELGRKHIGTIPAQRWTIRLEIANLPTTLKHAALAFPNRTPDLFIAPITLRGGQTAYQLFLGDYASKAEAEKVAKAVPAFFLEDGQRPKPFPVTGIPTRWNQ